MPDWRTALSKTPERIGVAGDHEGFEAKDIWSECCVRLTMKWSTLAAASRGRTMTIRILSRPWPVQLLAARSIAASPSAAVAWGPALYPAALVNPTIAPAGARADQIETESTDSHLRSTEGVKGYHIEAADGEIGHVDGFVMDDEAWALRYIEVATRNWWPGKKVLVAPAWIERVSWTDSKVYVGLSREAIQNGPEYVESKPITREYENRLYFHYGRPPYWLHQAEHRSSFSRGGA